MSSTAKLEQLIQIYIDSNQILGLAIALIDGDEVLYAGGFGRTSVEEGAAVTPRTLFGIGSISKTLLGTLIMRLVDAGRLDLDTPVVEYLPGFTFSNREFGERITLHRILSHTTGLPGAGKDWGPPDRDALERFIWDQLANHSFVAEPGRIHLYSSTAITLAGYIAEVVTGVSYRELVRELVCIPLMMDRTTFDHAVAMTYPLALPHEEDANGSVTTTHRWAENVSGEPSGFAMSTVLDLANLAIMHINGGQFRGQQFLSPESVSRMHTPVAVRPMPGARHPLAYIYTGYGLGVQTGSYRGKRVVRHGGMSQSFNCFFEVVPDEKCGMIVLTNYSREPHLSELIVRLYDHLLGFPDRGLVFVEPPQPLVPEREELVWPLYEGTYLNVEYGHLIAIRVRDNRLWYEENDRLNHLITISNEHYYTENSDGLRMPITFVPERNTPTEYMFVAGQPFRRIVLDETFVPDLKALRKYAGLYRDPSNMDPASDLDIRYEQDQLWVEDDGAEEPIRPLDNVTFLSSLGLIEFVVQNDRSVTSLILGKATRYDRVIK